MPKVSSGAGAANASETPKRPRRLRSNLCKSPQERPRVQADYNETTLRISNLPREFLEDIERVEQWRSPHAQNETGIPTSAKQERDSEDIKQEENADNIKPED
ncbi:hypothetical protein K491DRAFT_683122 [Lophiostoma macrostomum CBS 122681]|uniref:Uncharacterized protein n=1 Tax=Lophiostoma macrostomum CBS 122681 TaxID=1314788 RepID=A0A6A6SR29_9PLEO|nr:hypothetical protein K491DRAFT_683122 [Lophiostoma macrostomum CBS 122681]